jgi:hypothetical protein
LYLRKESTANIICITVLDPNTLSSQGHFAAAKLLTIVTRTAQVKKSAKSKDPDPDLKKNPEPDP